MPQKYVVKMHKAGLIKAEPDWLVNDNLTFEMPMGLIALIDARTR